jgi:hypothetical protein
MPQTVRALSVREESRDHRDSADKNPHDRKTVETFPVFPLKHHKIYLASIGRENRTFCNDD